jgi:hypothetical protein
MAYRPPQEPDRDQQPPREPGYPQAGRAAPDAPAGGRPRSEREPAEMPPRRGDLARLVLSEQPWAGRLPRARAGVAVVLVYKGGDCEVLASQDRRKRFGRWPVTVYEIDLGLRRARIEADLPSKGDVLAFHAVIELQWRASDLAVIAHHRALNIKDALSAELLRRLRDITRTFGIERSAEAEAQINASLGGAPACAGEPSGNARRQAADDGSLGAEYGLWTRVIVQLAVDEATSEHSSALIQLGRDITVEKKRQKLRKLQEKNERQLLAARIASYKEIIGAGDMNRFALQLASNPADVAAVAAMIREDEANMRTDTLRFVSDMVESGVIEPWEVSDQARETLQWLKRATARVIRGDRREPDEAGRPELETAPAQRRQGRDDPGGQQDRHADRLADGSTLEGRIVREGGNGAGPG